MLILSNLKSYILLFKSCQMEDNGFDENIKNITSRIVRYLPRHCWLELDGNFPDGVYYLPQWTVNNLLNMEYSKLNSLFCFGTPKAGQVLEAINAEAMKTFGVTIQRPAERLGRNAKPKRPFWILIHNMSDMPHPIDKNRGQVGLSHCTHNSSSYLILMSRNPNSPGSEDATWALQ